MNDFIQLKPQSNVYEAETMVEGWSFFFSFFLTPLPPRFFIGVYVSIFDFNFIYLFIFKIFQTLLFLSIHRFV